MYEGYFNDIDRYGWENHVPNKMKLFSECAKYLNLEEVKSFVTVGPGPGDMDMYLMDTMMPNVKEIYAVEPEETPLAGFKDNVDSKYEDKTVHCCVERGENWGGPTKKVDLVLLCHCLTLIPDTEVFLKRCTNWLKEGGIVLIMITHPSNISFVLREKFFGEKTRHSEYIKTVMRDIGWSNVEEFKKKWHLAIPPEEDFDGFTTVTTLAKRTETELKSMWEYLVKTYPDGQLSYTDVLFKWTKPHDA